MGTPRGTVVEIDLDGHETAEHDVLDGAAVGSLAVLATGQLIVAARTGDLVLLSKLGDSTLTHAVDSEPARHLVAEFVASTSELPDDANLDSDLVLTDGTRNWDPEDLTTVTTANPSDPTWLQLQAFMNVYRDRNA